MAIVLRKYQENPIDFPEAVEVDGMGGWHSYKVLAYRPPRKGDYYLTGKVDRAFLSDVDQKAPFHIIQIEPKH